MPIRVGPKKEMMDFYFELTGQFHGPERQTATCWLIPEFEKRVVVVTWGRVDRWLRTKQIGTTLPMAGQYSIRAHQEPS